MSATGTASEVWRFLRPLPVPWRLHQVIRSLVFPIERLLDYLPAPRTAADPVVLLDLGCGHGVLLALAKKRRPDLELVGLDLSMDKVAAARRSFEAAGIPVRALEAKDIAEFTKQSVDVITIVDVLYLVPIERWQGILRKCHECLRPGGRLLLKEMDPSIRWKLALLWLEETLAVRVFRLTLGGEFTFPTREQVRRQMEKAGFAVEEVPVDRGYFVPHHLWIGGKEGP